MRMRIVGAKGGRCILLSCCGHGKWPISLNKC